MIRVLLVDSEESTLNSLNGIMEKFSEKVEVFTAHLGQDAIALLDANPIDIVATDVQLSDMDGLELLTYINNSFPNIQSVVLAEKTSQEITENLEKFNIIKILSKPLDTDLAYQTFSELFAKNFTEGSVSGISLGSMLQLVEMEERSCLIGVKSSQSNQIGRIYIKDGVPYAALFGKNTGEEAIYHMIALSDVNIELRKPPTKRIKKNIHKSCMSLLLEGSRRLDESDGSAPSISDEKSSETEENMERYDDELTEADFLDTSKTPESESTQSESADSANLVKGDEHMEQVKELLENFKGIEGLEAVAVLTPDGEVASQLNPGNLSLQEVGALANDVLLKSQKSSESMGLGRGSMVHIDAPKGDIICRCLNEATDFATTSSGRAHIHLVVVLDKEGGMAMAKMKAENVIKELAPLFR